MAAASWFKYAYLAHLSQPKTDRQLYRLIKHYRVCRIVEVGITDLPRSAAWIEVAQRFAAARKVYYTGVDWFDARPADLSPVSLKQAHQALHPTGAVIRLVPGPPASSIPAVANAHQNTDLLLFSHWIEQSELERAWFYMPRMLHAHSLVLQEHLNAHGQHSISPIAVAEISQRAASHAGGRQRRAA